MPVAVVCPSCKAKLKAPETLIGKTVKCPGCTKPVLVKAVASAPAAPPSPAPAARKPAKQPTPVEEEPIDEIPAAEDQEEAAQDEAAAAALGGPSTDKERGTAMWIYLLPILLSCCMGIGSFISLFMWISKRKESPFIDYHGKNWLNLLINLFAVMVVLMIVSTILGFVAALLSDVLGTLVSGLFSLLMLAVAVYSLVLTIVAALKAKKGEWYQYRLLFKVLK